LTKIINYAKTKSGHTKNRNIENIGKLISHNFANFQKTVKFRKINLGPLGGMY